MRNAANAFESRRDRASTTRSQETNTTKPSDVDAATDRATRNDDKGESAPAAADVVTTAEPAEEQAILEVLTTTDPPAYETVPSTPVVEESVPDVSEPAESVGTSTTETSDRSGWSAPLDSVIAAPVEPAVQEVPVVRDDPAPVVRPTPIITMATTMTRVVVSLGNAVAAVPPVVFGLPFSSTPVSDVITMIETVLASLEDSVIAAAQLPSDLAALLGVGSMGPRPGAIAGSSDHRLAPVTVGPPLAVGLPTISPLLSLIAEEAARPAGELTTPETSYLGVLAAFTAPLRTLPTSVSVPLDEHSSLFDRTFNALLVPLSLWALATGALPGLGGLLVIFGAAIRVGYRQAKAGFAIRVQGIGRFARPGPLGVVRSGSLVALHPQSRRADARPATRWARLGDQAA